MASSTGNAKPKPDPKEEANRALQEALHAGLAKGKTIDQTDSLTRQKAAFKYQNLLSTQEFERQKQETDRQFKLQMAQEAMKAAEQAGGQSREKHLIGVSAQGEKIRMSAQAKMAAQQAEAKAAQAKQPSAMDVVNSTLAGTETKTFRPQAPMSTGPADVAGAEAMKVLQQIQGGAAAQQQGPVAQQGGPPPQQGGQGGPPPQQGPPQGGPQPSYQSGGQTFQAPPEITQRINELGINSTRMSGGTYNMPTFSSRSVTTPNVLSAGEAAGLNQRQQEAILESSWKMYQDSDGAPIDKIIAANTQLARTGDTGGLMAIVDAYPSLARAAGKADIEYRKALRVAALAQADASSAQAGLTNERRAFLKLQTSGAADAKSYGQWFGIGDYTNRGGGGVGVTAAGNPTLSAGGGGGGFAKLDVGKIWDNKEGKYETLPWMEYQKEILDTEGRLIYQNPGGVDVGPMTLGGDAQGVGSISVPDLANAFLVAQSGNASPEQRAMAIEALDQLPFVHVSKEADSTINIRPEGDDSSAAQLTGVLASNIKYHLESGAPIPQFIVSPHVAAAMAAQRATPAVPETPAALPPPTSKAGAKAGYPLRSKIRELVSSGAQELAQVPGAIGSAAKGWKPGLSAPKSTPRKPVGPNKFDVRQPPPITAVPGGGIPTGRQTEMQSYREPPPEAESRAMPGPGIGPQMQNLKPADVLLLRAAGMSPQAVASLPAEVVATILGGLRGAQMPPHMRALIPRGWQPQMRPTQRR